MHGLPVIPGRTHLRSLGRCARRRNCAAGLRASKDEYGPRPILRGSLRSHLRARPRKRPMSSGPPNRLKMIRFFVMAGHSRLKDGVACARLCPGHPRLSCLIDAKTWMPGTRPGMTRTDRARHFIGFFLSQTRRMTGALSRDALGREPIKLEWSADVRLAHGTTPSVFSSALAASHSRKLRGQSLAARRKRRVASSFNPFVSESAPL